MHTCVFLELNKVAGCACVAKSLIRLIETFIKHSWSMEWKQCEICFRGRHYYLWESIQMLQANYCFRVWFVMLRYAAIFLSVLEFSHLFSNKRKMWISRSTILWFFSLLLFFLWADSTNSIVWKTGKLAIRLALLSGLLSFFFEEGHVV